MNLLKTGYKALLFDSEDIQLELYSDAKVPVSVDNKRGALIHFISAASGLKCIMLIYILHKVLTNHEFMTKTTNELLAIKNINEMYETACLIVRSRARSFLYASIT